MTKNLNLSFVGCGHAADHMAALVRLTSGIQIPACFDRSEDRASQFARRHRIPEYYSSYEKLLDESKTDAVFLGVPHHLHFEMIKKAVDAGVHVFTEKPITRTQAEGKDVVAYARDKGIKIGVNYQYRYDRGLFKLAYLVGSGQLGRVLYGRTNIPWHREKQYFEESPWHKFISQAGGGTLITQASHMIDAALWVISSLPVSASGYTDRKVFTDVEVEDFAAGTVLLQNGAVLQITSSMVAVPQGAVTLEIYGDQGTAFYSNQSRLRVRLSRRVSSNPDQNLEARNSRNSRTGAVPAQSKVPYFGIHAMHRCLKGFRDWVLYDQPFLIQGETVLPALAVVEGLYQSAQEKCWVDITV